jgi:O-antigen ligase/tetratricopeptide (TPR) repeat protein
VSRGGDVIRVAAAVGIAVATLYGVFIGGAWSGIHSSALRSTTLLIVIIALAVWGVAALRSPAWRPRSAILPALLVPLAVLALTTATSRQPRLGLDYVAWSALLVALYLLLVRLMASDWFRPRMLALTTALGVIVGAWYLQEVFGKWIEWWGLVGRIAPPPLRPEFASLSFGNPSAVMTMSILLAMPAVAWIGFATPVRAIASVVLLALAGSSTILSGSRAGWVGLAIGWTVAIGMWLIPAGNRNHVARLVRSRNLRLVMGAAAVIAVAAGAVLLPGVLFRTATGGEALRLAYWQAALRMFGEAPLLGTGPGTWVAQRMRYTDAPANDYYIPHAHDIYIQTLAEMGVIGALAGLLVAVVVGGLLYRAVKSHDRPRVWMGWAAIFALAYYGGHQLLDFYPNFPTSLLAIAIPVAWLDAADLRAQAATGERQRPRRICWRAAALPVGGVVVLLVAAGFLRWSEASAGVHEQAVAALNDGDAARALEPAREAAAADPAMPPYQLTLGLAASKTGHPDEAAAAFARAAAADDFAVSWLGLAAARTELGDRASALDALDHALRLGRVQPAIAIGAADLYRRMGEPARADDFVAAAIAWDPRLASDLGLPTDDRDALIARILNRSDLRGSGFVIALEVGDEQALAAALAAADEPSRAFQSQVIAAWNGDAAAFAGLEASARARPLDLGLIVWVASVAHHRDPVLAVPFMKWAGIVNGTAGASATDIQTTPAGSEAASAGFSSSFYGHYTYRRPTPWNLTPDGVLGLLSR